MIHTVGEPFVYSRFEDALRICSESGIYIRITTNGLLLDRQMEAIARYPSAVRHIAFSIDGATKKTYEFMRRGGGFEKLLGNLTLIRGYIRRKKPPFSLSMQTCLSKENFDEIPLFYRIFTAYFGIDSMFFMFVSSLSAEREENACYRGMKVDLAPLYKRSDPCRLLWSQTHVLHDGRVSACCRDYEGSLVMGDIGRESILDIWNGEKYKELRSKHLSGDLDDVPACRDCISMDLSCTFIFNAYLRYLFSKFRGRPDGFYMDKVNAFLRYIVSVKENKERAGKGLPAAGIL